MRCSADKCSKYITGFRVRAVMTTSIPVQTNKVKQQKHYTTNPIKSQPPNNKKTEFLNWNMKKRQTTGKF